MSMGGADRVEALGAAAERRACVLIADSSPTICRRLSTLLTMRGHDVLVAHDAAELTLLGNGAASVALVDLAVLTAAGAGIGEWVRRARLGLEVIVMVEAASIDAAVGAVREGAYSFLVKPLRTDDEVTMLVDKAVERRELLEKARLAPNGSPVLASRPPTEAENLAYKEAKQRAISAFDRIYFAELLERTGGNVSEAARRSGLDRSNFRRALKRVGVLPSR